MLEPVNVERVCANLTDFEKGVVITVVCVISVCVYVCVCVCVCVCVRETTHAWHRYLASVSVAARIAQQQVRHAQSMCVYNTHTHTHTHNIRTELVQELKNSQPQTARS